MSAHIEEVDKDLDPPDNSRPDKSPQDKGKGCTEGKHPNNIPPDDRMAQVALTTLTTTLMVPRLNETLSLLTQFTKGSLVSL